MTEYRCIERRGKGGAQILLVGCSSHAKAAEMTAEFFDETDACEGKRPKKTRRIIVKRDGIAVKVFVVTRSVAYTAKQTQRIAEGN